jgi:pSer/pThr/pTyr-binding forkhead associated (FHA) protein
MSEPIDPTAERVLIIQLLDASQGLPIQTWTFPVQPEIRIGRASDNDVVITHPYVSRYHTRMLWRNGDWEVVNMGTHGTLLGGRSVSRALLEEGAELRLGPLGPTLRCRGQKSESGVTPRGTLMGALTAAPVIHIDAAKTEQEVRAVVDNDYFRQLQERLQTLRARRT